MQAKFDGLVLNTTTTQLDVSLKHLGELDGASNEKLVTGSWVFPGTTCFVYPTLSSTVGEKEFRTSLFPP